MDQILNDNITNVKIINNEIIFKLDYINILISALIIFGIFLLCNICIILIKQIINYYKNDKQNFHCTNCCTNNMGSYTF